MSEEDCRAALAKGNYFGTMLVKMGKADALLGGAADTAALYDLSAHRAALLALWARAAGSDCF